MQTISAKTQTRVGELSLPTRAWVLLTYLVITYIVYSLVVVDGWWQPTGGGLDLWFLSVTGLVTIRLIEAPFFRKPSDSLLSALMAAFVLWTIDLQGIEHQALLDAIRWVAILYMVLIFCTSLVSITVLRSNATRPVVRDFFFRVSTHLGAPELLFTPAVFISLIGFHDIASSPGVGLAGIWFLLVVIRPVEEAISLFKTWRKSTTTVPNKQVGNIARIDAPNIMRVSLERQEPWHTKSVLVARLATGSHVIVLPLFSQVKEDSILGTGLVSGTVEPAEAMPPGLVFESSECPGRDQVVAELLNETETSAKLIGFVVEGSTISQIQFEVALEEDLQEGLVIFCIIAGRRVYYQIVSARTEEETFDNNPRGTLRVTASQLGMPHDVSGFDWYPWVPGMNTPVFQSSTVLQSASKKKNSNGANLFQLGLIPGTNNGVGIEFNDILKYHTAVLGVTGVGKTELVFDLIRNGLDRRAAKIICVDFTGEYIKRLHDYEPTRLGLSPERISELETLIDAVEEGAYSAGEEKEALRTFIKDIHPEIATKVNEFLEYEGSGLAIFELDEIANTRTTLRATELYLSEIFKWAKTHRRAREILLVLEEAHTIIPESNLFGFDRSDTAAVVGRMSQIALQGRKYGVGILLVSQRTALVSKTVLSQCNNYFCFSLVDKTSLDYMSNVFGTQHLAVIPNLRVRQLVAYGPGVHSEKPVIVEIPFDEEKKRACDSLDVEIQPPDEKLNSEDETQPTHEDELEDDVPF